MSLKPCRECGEQVNSKAQSCPKCGIKKPVKGTPIFLPIMVGFGLLIVFFSILDGADKNNKPEETSLAAQEPSRQVDSPAKPNSAQLQSPNRGDTPQALAECVLMASNTYHIPAAVLIGIMHIEGGHVGEDFPPSKNGDYGIGPMKVGSDLLPDLTKMWNVDLDTAHKWVRDDGCVNVHVAAWILRQKMDDAGSIWDGIAAYHPKDGKPDYSFAAAVVKVMDDKGLVKHDAPLPFIAEKTKESDDNKISAHTNNPGMTERTLMPLGLFFDLKTITAEDALHAYHKCVMHSASSGKGAIGTMQSCVDIGILWCNKSGEKTAPASTMSTVTGKVFINNQTCAIRLDGQYQFARGSYEHELESYIASESYGIPYHPVSFDIRSVWGWKGY
jgi:hypothetical protein